MPEHHIKSPCRIPASPRRAGPVQRSPMALAASSTPPASANLLPPTFMTAMLDNPATRYAIQLEAERCGRASAAVDHVATSFARHLTNAAAIPPTSSAEPDYAGDREFVRNHSSSSGPEQTPLPSSEDLTLDEEWPHYPVDSDGDASAAGTTPPPPLPAVRSPPGEAFTSPPVTPRAVTPHTPPRTTRTPAAFTSPVAQMRTPTRTRPSMGVAANLAGQLLSPTGLGPAPSPLDPFASPLGAFPSPALGLYSPPMIPAPAPSPAGTSQFSSPAGLGPLASPVHLSALASPVGRNHLMSPPRARHTPTGAPRQLFGPHPGPIPAPYPSPLFGQSSGQPLGPSFTPLSSQPLVPPAGTGRSAVPAWCAPSHSNTTQLAAPQPFRPNVPSCNHSLTSYELPTFTPLFANLETTLVPYVPGAKVTQPHHHKGRSRAHRPRTARVTAATDGAPATLPTVEGLAYAATVVSTATTTPAGECGNVADPNSLSILDGVNDLRDPHDSNNSDDGHRAERGSESNCSRARTISPRPGVRRTMSQCEDEPGAVSTHPDCNAASTEGSSFSPPLTPALPFFTQAEHASIAAGAGLCIVTVSPMEGIDWPVPAEPTLSCPLPRRTSPTPVPRRTTSAFQGGEHGGATSMSIDRRARYIYKCRPVPLVSGPVFDYIQEYRAAERALLGDSEAKVARRAVKRAHK